MGSHHSCYTQPDNYRPGDYYISPYYEYMWYNNMGPNQCSWMTTPPTVTAQCHNLQPPFGWGNCSSDNSCVKDSSTCSITGGGDDFFVCENVVPAVKAVPPLNPPNDTDLLKQRNQILQDVNNNNNNITPKDLWMNLSYNNVGPTYSNFCMSNRASQSFTIPDYAATNDNPVDVAMPMANLLYDSTNCGPKTNAKHDWNTTSYTDIIAVMDGAVKTTYMLVPASGSGGLPAGNTAIAGVKVYPKTYNFGWIQDLEYCAHLNDQEEACNASMGCTYESNECKHTSIPYVLGGSEKKTKTLNYATAPPGKKFPFPFEGYSALTFDLDSTTHAFGGNSQVCLSPWTPPSQVDNPGSNPTCTAGSGSPYSPSTPLPPIVVENKVVETYCQRFNVCSNESPCAPEIICPSDTPCYNNTNGTCEAEVNNTCQTDSIRNTLHQFTCKPTKTDGTCPTYYTKCGDTEGGGVCYSTDMNDMGAPMVNACMAVPTPQAGTENAIPPFDIQTECFGKTSKKTCDETTLTGTTEYRCRWEAIETNNGCSKHTTKTDCTQAPSCNWGTCTWLAESNTKGGICQAAANTNTIHNIASDPFVWSMWDNFTKASDTNMSCGSNCQMSTINAQGTDTPWGQPTICTTDNSRNTIGSTGLNGIPFCIKEADPGG